jgi:hypothetical protein
VDGTAAPRLNVAAQAGFLAERARPEDDTALRELLRARAMHGQIQLSLEREPSFARAQAIEGDRHHTVVVRNTESGEIVGMGTRSVREVWVNGERRRVGYLGALRAAPGRRGLVRLAAGYRAVEATRRADELPFDLTSVIEDNATARRLLERGLPGLPRYEPLCDYATMLIPVGRGLRRADARGEAAGAADLAEIAHCLERNLQRHQFAPVCSERELLSAERHPDLALGDFAVIREAGRIVGCAARWDQRRFKQVVVRGYAPLLARTRPLLNLFLGLGGRPQLPAVGAQLPLAYVACLAVDDDRPDLALALIDALRTCCAGGEIQALAVGFAHAHPLRAAIERAYPVRAYASCLYRVRWPGAPEVALDARVPHLEVATL